MKIVIVGCGRFGSIITDLMLSQGHDVVVVDSNETKIENVNNTRDVLAICGNGSDYNLLDEIGMKDTDVFVACTASDEINLLASKLSKAMGAKHTITRVLTHRPGSKATKFIKDTFSLELVISPDYLTAKDAYKILTKHAVKSAIIIGATRAGTHLTQLLVDSGVAVKVIDSDPRRCEHLHEVVSGSPIIINSDESSHQVLLDAGITTVDAVVTATPMDAENILVSMYASDCKVPLIITKIDNASYTNIVNDLTLEHVISPRISTANIVLDYVKGLEK